MIVCLCRNITEREVVNAVQSTDSVNFIEDNGCYVCCKCNDTIKMIFDKTVSQTAEIVP